MIDLPLVKISVNEKETHGNIFYFTTNITPCMTDSSWKWYFKILINICEILQSFHFHCQNYVMTSITLLLRISLGSNT